MEDSEENNDDINEEVINLSPKSDTNDLIDDMDLNSLFYSNVKSVGNKVELYNEICFNRFKNLLNTKKEEMNTIKSYIESTPISSEAISTKLEKYLKNDQEFIEEYCENILKKLEESHLNLKVAERELKKHEGLLKVYRERLSFFEQYNRSLKLDNIELQKKIVVNEKVYEINLQKIKDDVQLAKKIEKKFDSPKTGICEAYTLLQISEKAYDFVKYVLEFPLPTMTELNAKSNKLKLRSSIIYEVVNEMKFKALAMSEKDRLCSLQFYEFEPSKDIADCSLLCTKSNKKRLLLGLVEGIYDNWKQPIYIEFNELLSVEIVHSTIDILNEIGFRVLTLITEFNIFNVRLWRLLNISNVEPYFRSHSGKYVHVVPDIFHLYNTVVENSENFCFSRTVNGEQVIKGVNLPFEQIIDKLNFSKDLDISTHRDLLPFTPFSLLIKSLCFILKVNNCQNSNEFVKFDGPYIDYGNEIQGKILGNFLGSLIDKHSVKIDDMLDLHYAICVTRNAVKSLTTICKTFQWSMIKKLSLDSVKSFGNNLVILIKDIYPLSVVSVLYYARAYLTDPSWRKNESYLVFNDEKNVHKQIKVIKYLNKLPVEMKISNKNKLSSGTNNVEQKCGDTDEDEGNSNNGLKEKPYEKVSDDLGQNIAKELRRILDVKNSSDEDMIEQGIKSSLNSSNLQKESSESPTEEITSIDRKHELKNQIKASIIGNKSVKDKNERVNEKDNTFNKNLDVSTSNVDMTINCKNNLKKSQKNVKEPSSVQTFCIKNIQSVFKKKESEQPEQDSKPEKQFQKRYTILKRPTEDANEAVAFKATDKRKSISISPPAGVTTKKIKQCLPMRKTLPVKKVKNKDESGNFNIIPIGGKTKESCNIKIQDAFVWHPKNKVIPITKNTPTATTVTPMTYIPIPSTSTSKLSSGLLKASTSKTKPSLPQMKPSTFTITPSNKNCFPLKLPTSVNLLTEASNADEDQRLKDDLIDTYEIFDSIPYEMSESDPLNLSP